MNIEKYTENARQAIVECQNIAVSEGNQEIQVEHLALVLLMQRDGLIPKLINAMGIDPALIIGELEEEIQRLPKVSGGADNVYASRRFSQVVLAAEKEATKFKDEYVSVEHLFLAILDERDGKAARILTKNGLRKDDFLKALTMVRGNQRVTNQNPENSYDALNKYGRDLVQLAKEGKMDPVIGRDAEVRRTIQILSRRTKNNPVLIGEPLLRDWHSVFLKATCRRDFRTRQFSLSTWVLS